MSIYTWTGNKRKDDTTSRITLNGGVEILLGENADISQQDLDELSPFYNFAPGVVQVDLGQFNFKLATHSDGTQGPPFYGYARLDAQGRVLDGSSNAVGNTSSSLTPTAVKSGAYAAAAGDLVRADASAGVVPLTLPNAPADKTQIAVKVTALTSPNTVTVATQGADVFNATGGATSFTMRAPNQSAIFQYDATNHIWTLVSSDVPLSFTDARYRQTASSRIFFGPGDSITQKGRSDSNADGTGSPFDPLLQGRAWYAHAMMLAEGRLLYGGQGATGGLTTAQAFTTHLATALASPCEIVMPLTGRNDVVALTGTPSQATIDAAFLAEMTPFKNGVMQILAAGRLVPIATLPAAAGNSSAQIQLTERINAWRRKFALFNRLPVVDFAAATTDPTTGGQKTGMFVDASHPGPGLGARTMGAELCNRLLPFLVPQKPPHAMAQTSPADGGNLFPNPLHLTLTGGAGTDPTGWTSAGAGTGTFTTADPAATGNDALGLWASLQRTSGTGTVQRYSAKIAVSPGDIIATSFRFKTTVEAASAWAALRWIGNANSGDVPTSTVAQYFAGINTWLGDVITPGLYYQENTVAAGVNFLSLVASLSSGSGAAKLDFSQVGFFNLTKMGALS
jgi:hypothetical protein